MTKIGIFRKFDINWDFSKIWPKLRFFENFHQNGDFSKVLTEIEIFRKFWSKSRFANILTKIAIFRKFWPKSRYISKLLTSNQENRDFQIFGPTSTCFDKNQDFSKILTKFEIFTNFDQNRYFFKNLRTKIFEDIAQNRGITKIFTKIETFKDFDQNRYFSKILTKIAIFLTFGQNPDC